MTNNVYLFCGINPAAGSPPKKRHPDVNPNPPPGQPLAVAPRRPGTQSR